MGRALVSIALGVSLASCSIGEPDDLVFISGRVFDATGSPLEGQVVRVLRSEDFRCSSILRPEVRPPLGARLSEFRSTKTDAEGAYLVQLLRAEMELGYSLPRCFRLVVESPDGALSRIQAQSESKGSGDLALPDLPLWGGAQVSLGTAPGEVRLSAESSWRPELFSAVEPDWVAKSSNDYAWAETAEPATFDGYVLEDYELSAGLEFLDERVVTPGGPFAPSRELQTALQSQAHPLARGALVPASRGAQCSYADKEIEPCWLTDGVLELRTLTFNPPLPTPTPGPASEPPKLVLTFANAVSPRVILIRDLQTSFWGDWNEANVLLVEGFSEGGRWTLLHSRKLAPLASQAGRIAAANRFIRFSDASALPVQQLRVSLAHPGGLAGLREISVFE